MSLLRDPVVVLVKQTDSCTQRLSDVAKGAAEPTGGVLKKPVQINKEEMILRCVSAQPIT